MVVNLSMSTGRSPRGERGLKFLPSAVARARARSLPSRGAWIEIPQGFPQGLRSHSRSPRGERGLKLIALDVHPDLLVVAPLAGSVD